MASQNIESMIPVPQEMVGNQQNVFALQVKGDSMINAHIMPRDLVIIKQTRSAENGDLVAVLLGDEATVKHIQFTSDGVRLLASNPAYDPIEIKREDSHIIGKVIGLIRGYDAPVNF